MAAPNGADDDDATFHPFGRLPPELRQTIWTETIPNALVYPRVKGFVFHPSPSPITQVNREARATAYRMGGPVAVDTWERNSNSAWLNPGHDTVLFGSAGIPKSTGNLVVKKVPLNNRARSVVLPDNWNWSQQVQLDPYFLCSSVKTLAAWPHLESIMIWPQCPPRDSWHVSPAMVADKHHWPQKTIDSVFGDDSLRLVDLTNNADVHGVVAQLVSANVRHDLPHVILRARDLYRGNMEWCPNYWAEAVRSCEMGWLIGKFEAAAAVPQAQHDHGANASDIPVDISLNDYQFDRQNHWVNKMLTQMPQPRPVFLLARGDTGAFLEGQARRKRSFFEALPNHVYDDESRLFKRARYA